MGSVKLIGSFPKQSEKVGRVGSGMAQFLFYAHIYKLLCPEKYNESCCHELVTPRNDANIFKVFRKLGKNKGLVS